MLGAFALSGLSQTLKMPYILAQGIGLHFGFLILRKIEMHQIKPL
jgi:hypothetical protein